ncbi:MAG: thiamine pyrophosphate-binding protein [Victivallaceae bacterium]
MKMKAADFVFQYLAGIGVEDVFMVSGGGAMFLNDALGREAGMRYICTHHEQGAAIAAEGYARTSGKLAVVSVTTGPGGTNSLTGVIGEWLDSIPVLFLSGQVKFPTTIASCPELGLRQLGDQEINIVDIVRPVTKYAVMVTDPARIKYELGKAIHLATTGRCGPVWLDIPINVQSAEIDPDTLESYVPANSGKPALAPETVDRVLDALRRAKSPVIIAGHGIRLAGAAGAFGKLLEKLPVPVLSTLGGFDLMPSADVLAVGRIGTIGNRAGNIVLQNADCVLAIGTRNNIRQISYNYENFAKRANDLMVVDIDPAELAKPTVNPTLRIHADAGDFIAALDRALESAPALPDYRSWCSWTAEKAARYSPVLPEYAEVPEKVQPYYFIDRLTRQLPEESVVACTNATPSIALFQAGVVKPGQLMFANSGCAAMGFGLPAALGAAVAAPERLVVCLEGDGSLMMNLQELQTVRSHHYPVKLFLFANREYSSIRQTHDAFFAGRHTGCDGGSGVTFPDWWKVAAAFDWPYVKIDSQRDLDAQIAAVLAMPGPVFCELDLVPGYIFAPKLSSRRLPDGSIVSPSLEDMFPFLPEAEMRNNVYRPEK